MERHPVDNNLRRNLEATQPAKTSKITAKVSWETRPQLLLWLLTEQKLPGPPSLSHWLLSCSPTSGICLVKSTWLQGFPGGAVVKNLPGRRHGFNPWVSKIPWRRKWQPIPIFSPVKSYGQRSLAGYNPLGRKESDKTEQLNTANNTYDQPRQHIKKRRRRFAD